MRKLKNAQILAIESSADETSAAVLIGNKKNKRFRIASNVVYSQMKIHKKYGGIVPEVAARAHIPKILPVIRHALAPLSSPPREGGIEGGLKSIDAIAVTAGPGLITSLRVGVDTAKALAYALDVPVIPVNHHEGHLLSALATVYPSPRSGEGGPTKVGPGEGVNFPAVGLVVSGGHTMLVLVKGIGQYKILGETLDDAAGEAFDKIAKLMRLPYPGGPSVALRATKFKMQRSKIKIELPRPMIDSQNYDFSFSGLKTAVLYKIKELQKLSNQTINQIAHETEQAIVDVLIAKTIRAAKEYKAKTILLGGGVSANAKLRQTLTREAKKLNTKYLIPDTSLSTDNAGMIAIVGFYKYLAGKTNKYSQIKADPNLRLKSWS